MTLLFESVDAKKYDVRVIEKNIARGMISPSDVQKEMSALPDDGENADWVSLDSLKDEDESPRTSAGETESVSPSADH